jgi:chaperonin GroES|tara:strand:- start:378 stop:674 length:297 start_codon:yes stop_codon:yes gene_type:complete
MIKPMDARVVVKKPTRAEQTESGIILPDTVDEGTQTSQGEVLAVGPGSRNMNTGEPMPMDVKVGDRVIYTKYQGVEVNHNGEELFVIMERDIIAIVEG